MSTTAGVVWVTGGSSGIGEATARSFAAAGHRVVVSSRSGLTGQPDSADRLETHGIMSLPCDVTQPEAVAAAHAAIIDRHGRVDVLVNAAGVTTFRSFLETSVDDFDRIHATNLRGAFLCAKAVLPSMLERQSGMIVMVNSVAAQQVFKDSSVYASSKAGLKMMT